MSFVPTETWTIKSRREVPILLSWIEIDRLWLRRALALCASTLISSAILYGFIMSAILPGAIVNRHDSALAAISLTPASGDIEAQSVFTPPQPVAENATVDSSSPVLPSEWSITRQPPKMVPVAAPADPPVASTSAEDPSSTSGRQGPSAAPSGSGYDPYAFASLPHSLIPSLTATSAETVSTLIDPAEQSRLATLVRSRLGEQSGAKIELRVAIDQFGRVVRVESNAAMKAKQTAELTRLLIGYPLCRPNVAKSLGGGMIALSL